MEAAKPGAEVAKSWPLQPVPGRGVDVEERRPAESAAVVPLLVPDDNGMAISDTQGTTKDRHESKPNLQNNAKQ